MYEGMGKRNQRRSNQQSDQRAGGRRARYLEGLLMPKYFVKTVVEFSNEVEAESREQAEAMGWDWEDELLYDGVYSIDVEELDEDEDED